MPRAERYIRIPLNPLRWKKRYRSALVVGLGALGLLVIYAPSIISLGYFVSLSAEISALPAAAPITSKDRLLIIAPHPDDETLACSGAIQQAIEAGAPVKVVWLTCGDGFEWDELFLSHRAILPQDGMIELGKLRAKEARQATRELGLADKDGIFLGYPDGSLLRLFLDYYARTCRSRYTRVSEVPYDFALHPGARYMGQELERDLDTVIDGFKPTVVLCPAIQDHHPDHRAAAYFMLRLMGERGQLERLRWYIVHGGVEWPMPKGYHPKLPMGIPPRGLHLRWQRVDLSQPMQEAKRRAITAYDSQRRVIGGFLLAFDRTNELEALDLSLEPVPAE
jgi:LmbE family N-acetylglucosaminyl deacetylase